MIWLIAFLCSWAIVSIAFWAAQHQLNREIIETIREIEKRLEARK